MSKDGGLRQQRGQKEATCCHVVAFADVPTKLGVYNGLRH